ncbi:MAG: hypothetical protein D6731_05005 [Planctomycetota bacterium]|nr:MAG: hypothetical protein D6731_05005 [Planctomycetota bacterium]
MLRSPRLRSPSGLLFAPRAAPSSSPARSVRTRRRPLRRLRRAAGGSLVAAILGAPLPARADLVYLAGEGRPLAGTVVAETPQRLLLRLPDGSRRVLLRGRVQRVVPTAQRAAELAATLRAQEEDFDRREADAGDDPAALLALARSFLERDVAGRAADLARRLLPREPAAAQLLLALGYVELPGGRFVPAERARIARGERRLGKGWLDPVQAKRYGELEARRELALARRRAAEAAVQSARQTLGEAQRAEASARRERAAAKKLLAEGPAREARLRAERSDAEDALRRAEADARRAEEDAHEAQRVLAEATADRARAEESARHANEGSRRDGVRAGALRDEAERAERRATREERSAEFAFRRADAAEQKAADDPGQPARAREADRLRRAARRAQRRACRAREEARAAWSRAHAAERFARAAAHRAAEARANLRAAVERVQAAEAHRETARAAARDAAAELERTRTRLRLARERLFALPAALAEAQRVVQRAPARLAALAARRAAAEDALRAAEVQAARALARTDAELGAVEQAVASLRPVPLRRGGPSSDPDQLLGQEELEALDLGDLAWSPAPDEGGWRCDVQEGKELRLSVRFRWTPSNDEAATAAAGALEAALARRGALRPVAGLGRLAYEAGSGPTDRVLIALGEQGLVRLELRQSAANAVRRPRVGASLRDLARWLLRRQLPPKR